MPVTLQQEGAELDGAWQAAWVWLCQQRRHAPPNADIWHLRYHWRRDGERLRAQVQRGDYRLSAMQVIRASDSTSAMWCAQDALVLKWVALKVSGALPLHRRCFHVKGHGGSRGSITAVRSALNRECFAYVLRTDIKGYYRHIRKEQVLQQVWRYVADPVLRGLIRQYVHYSVEWGGEFVTPESGICRGCALSPLIGASLLHHVDTYFSSREAVFYARYMDDFLVLAPTRWHLRRAVRDLNRFFNQGGFIQHPNKTQIGRVEKGFDWLGLWFDTTGVAMAPRALEHHRMRRVRLYEQALAKGLSRTAAEARVHVYKSRWTLWAEGMLNAARDA